VSSNDVINIIRSGPAPIVDTIGECWPIFNELTYFIKNSRPLKLIWDDVREYKLHTSIHESPCLECLELESEFQSLDGMRTQTGMIRMKREHSNLKHNYYHL
jgi:hypothetical protein